MFFFLFWSLSNLISVALIGAFVSWWVSFYLQIPSVQPPALQHPQQSAPQLQQPNFQATQASSGQVGLQDQTSASQTQTSIRKQHQNQPAMPISTASLPAANLQSQPMHSHALQVPQQLKGRPNAPLTTMSLPQPSQHSSMPPISHHSASQPPSLHQPQMPAASSQLQPPLQSTGPPHMPLQPPLPQQPRPASMQSFHQYAPHVGSTVGFQHPAAQQRSSQPMYHVSWISLVIVILGISQVSCNNFFAKLASQDPILQLALDLHSSRVSHQFQVSHCLNLFIRYVCALRCLWIDWYILSLAFWMGLVKNGDVWVSHLVNWLLVVKKYLMAPTDTVLFLLEK